MLITCHGTIGIKGTAEEAPAHIMVKAIRDHQEAFSSTTRGAEALEREQEPGHRASTATTSDQETTPMGTQSGTRMRGQVIRKAEETTTRT